MIKDQGNRLGHRRDHGQQPGHHSAQDRGAGRSEGLEQLRVDGLYLVQHGGDIGQQHHRVVVPLVDRDPSRTVPLAGDPLGQQGGPAVSRGATTQITGTGAASSRSTNAGRATIPDRADGGWSLDTTRLKDDPVRYRQSPSGIGTSWCPLLLTSTRRRAARVPVPLNPRAFDRGKGRIAQRTTGWAGLTCCRCREGAHGLGLVARCSRSWPPRSPGTAAR